MSAPRLTQAERDAILAEYKAGVALKVIAERYGVAVTYPSMMANRKGIARRRERTIVARGSKADPERIEAAGTYSVWHDGIRVSLPAVSILKTNPLERGCSSAASAICSTHSSRVTADGMGGEKLDSNYRHIVVQAHPPANSTEAA